MYKRIDSDISFDISSENIVFTQDINLQSLFTIQSKAMDTTTTINQFSGLKRDECDSGATYP